MKLNVVTPYGQKFKDDNVESVTLPTESGVITILDDHVPMISTLTPGEIIVKVQNEERIFAVSKGVVEIKAGSIVGILADTVERAEEIDVSRAMEAKKAAEEMLKKKLDLEDVEFARLMSKLEKELTRINIGKKWKK